MKLPVLPTLLVGLAVAAMIALGVWQLDRRGQKEALIAQYHANAALPEMAMPGPGDWHAALFRRVAATCQSVAGWSSQAGRATDGMRGWRKLAQCRTGGAEGPGLTIDMGVGTDAKATPAWSGGVVTGVLSEAPSHSSVIARALGRTAAPSPMLIAATAAPGLKPSAPPSPETVPNNHLAYAVQWFLFAGIALIIYLLALRRRVRTQATGRAED